MSTRKSAVELSQVVYSYLLEQHPGIDKQGFYYCMDKRVFDDPNAAFYPDIENRFITHTAAFGYLLETGLPLWVVADGTNYPVDLFTYRKCEFLFNL